MDVTPDLEHDSLSIFTPTQSIFVKLMSGSSHLDRESIVKIGVECQICVIVIFFNCSRDLKFEAHSRY